MKISILTMCPELFRYFEDSPIISRAVENGRAEIDIIDFRDYTNGSFRKIDDSPYGGGPGMVIRCQPVVDAIEDIRTDNSHVVLLSPKGKKYDQKMAREFAENEHLVLVCGHYEGFDARIFPYADEVVSVGDYVLSGGELAAQIITDSVTRLLDGSLKTGSADEESFEDGLLEYPQYTRPADFRGEKVPEILLSGNHEAIREWRKEQAVELTKRNRPDLLADKPVIAVPIGDPAGIGPEIVVKALARPEVQTAADVIVIGDRRVLERAIELTGSDLTIHVIESPDKRVVAKSGQSNVLNLIELSNIDQSVFQYGKVQGMCGKAAYEYIEKSIALALNREVDAVATTPINKESLRAAGVPFIGHTEIFGALTDTEDPLTMFETNGLRIFFLTRHKSLQDMLKDITKENIKRCVKECTQALRRLGVTEGTMAIAGLNPHCGEHGLFGWEEVNEIAPAVKELKAEGYQVAGPIGADSVFHQAAIGRYNSVLSLYHDQGHIAAKTLDFDRTISVTNGMPILRTSVDHGTAFDIAGKGIASETSMVEAILLAAKYAPFFMHISPFHGK